MRVLIVGCGGHGQVIADALFAQNGEQKPVGFVDDNSSLWGTEVCELPVYGATNQRYHIEYDSIIISIGDNQVRRTVFDQLITQGETLATVIHPCSTIATNVSIGIGTFVAAHAVVATGSLVGENSIINTASSVDHHNSIGDHVLIGPGAHLGGDVTIGGGALIGIGATVLPQRTVGANAIVAAGSVVTKDVPPGAKVFGIPAENR